jgi:hypothetical protein
LLVTNVVTTADMAPRHMKYVDCDRSWQMHNVNYHQRSVRTIHQD